MPRRIYCHARPSVLTRLRDRWSFRRRRFERELANLDWLGGDDGSVGSGVREPRRPLGPSLSGSVALDLPDE